MDSIAGNRPGVGGKLSFYLAMFLTSLSLFIYEVLLTRLFSAVLSVSMVHLVVSFAILGSGLGGILTYRMIKGKRQLKNRDLLRLFSPMLPVSMGACVAIIYFMPYIPIYIVYAVIGAIPNIIGGILISAMFMDNAAGSGRLYFMDLVGSALGSLAVIQIMDRFGFMASVVLVCILSLLASILVSLFYMDKRRIYATAALVIMLSGLFAQNSWIRGIEGYFNSFYTNPDKVLNFLNETTDKPTRISFTKWDSISRTDVIDTTNEKEKIITTDGGGAAPIIRFDGDLNTVEYLKREVNYIPFTFGTNDSALVIGSGGGKDVLFALLGGAGKIDAVEINRSTIEAVDNFKDFSGDIYNQPGVKVYNQDGRNFVKNSVDKYDNIYLSMVMTNAIENNMYSLSENYIYTYEAFEEYFDHLTDDGKLSFMTHNTLDMVKILNTGIKVLLDRGISPKNVTDYFIVVNGMEKGHEASHADGIGMPLIIFKNKPFLGEDINIIGNTAYQHNRSMVHYPGNEVDIYKDLKDGKVSYEELIDMIKLNVKPTRDQSPFFYNYSKFIPIEMLYVLLAILPIGFLIRKGFKNREYKRPALYFAGLGMAFMLVEIPVIQKMVLYFGNPSQAFSIVLFSILISSGIGSWLSSLRFVRKSILKTPIYLLAVSVSILAVQFTIGDIMAISSDFTMAMKSGVGFLALMPMGLLMGIPFPTGISRLKENGDEGDLIPLMWGVNGIFSVAGSILAIILSMLIGFDAALYTGAAVYGMLYFLNPMGKFTAAGN